jgi:iron complex outermembrane receptor protein
MKSIYLLSTSLLVIGFPGAAFAQQGMPTAPDAQSSSSDTVAPQQFSAAVTASDNEIIVTGFRRSLNVAAEAKRNADIISDGISAEDIGQFPDLNLAESLQRITGVQITRSGGEGSGVSIRGLPTEFTRVQYNGRTVGSGGTRSFDFTAFSSLFTSAVEVQKSPTSDMIDGGLSGTVNVETARPLDVNKTTVSASLEGVYEQERGKVTPRAAILGNWVNDAGTFGVTGGIAFERREFRNRSDTTYGAETSRESPLIDPVTGRATTGGKTPALDYNGNGDFNDTYSFTHGSDFWTSDVRRDRLTGILGYQWKPSEDLEIYGDFFYSRLKSFSNIQRSQTRFTDIAPGTAGSTNFGIRGSTIVTDYNDLLPSGSQGFLTRMDVDGLSTQAVARIEEREIEVKSFAQGAKWTSGDLTLSAEGSYFKSNNGNKTIGLNAQARGSASLEYVDGIGTLPQITFNRGFDQLNPNNYYLTNEDLQQNIGVDRNYEGRIDATYRLGDGFVRSLKFGGFYSDRHFQNVSGQGVLDATALTALSNGRLVVTPGIEGSGGILAADFLKQGDYNGLTNAPALMAIDLNKFNQIISRADYFDNQDVPVQAGSGFDIAEKTFAFYGRADFATADDRLAGNVGLRYVKTRTTSIGLVPDLDGLIVEVDRVTTTIPTAESTAVDAQYDDFLPSLNLRYNVTDAFVARFAAARVIGRPGLGSLNAGTSVDANVRTINSGNPSLKPFRSDQVDVSLEYYLPKGGLLSLAGFYKHLTDYILSGQTLETRTVTLRAGGTQSLEFRRNQPLNLANGDVKGVEVAAQLPFSYIAQGLDGLGFFGSYTFIDAPSFPRTQGGVPVPLDGVAKNNFTLGGYFEKWGLGVRGSYTYRGRYASGAGTFGDGSFTRAYGQLDGSIDYKLTDNISASIDVTNLLGVKSYSENGFGLISNESFTGRRFTGGVRVKF